MGVPGGPSFANDPPAPLLPVTKPDFARTLGSFWSRVWGTVPGRAATSIGLDVYKLIRPQLRMHKKASCISFLTNSRNEALSPYFIVLKYNFFLFSFYLCMLYVCVCRCTCMPVEARDWHLVSFSIAFCPTSFWGRVSLNPETWLVSLPTATGSFFLCLHRAETTKVYCWTR